MTLRTDTRVFLKKRADAIVNSVLRAYPQANFRFDLSPDALQAAPVRGTTTQYDETDAAFVARLLSEEGWNWRLEHQDDGQPLSSAKAAKHCLVISDPLAPRVDLGNLRFGRPDLRDGGGLLASLLGKNQDTITAIAVERSVQTNAITHGAWDGRSLAGVSSELASTRSPAGVPQLESYDGRGQGRFTNHLNGENQASSAVADARAALDLARHELAMKTLHGQSAVRTLAPGANFALTEHSLYSGQGAALASRTDNQFLVLSITHEAANNLDSEAARLLDAPELEAGSYRNHFTAVPAAATLVPPYLAKPLAPMQTATVVGHAEEALSTDRDLRVWIQLPWQRGEQPVAGGLNGPLTPGQEATGHAPGDTSASLPARVAQQAAGANWGAVFIPRLGAEVLVDFIEGDVDQPMVVAQLHNGRDTQPWPAGVDSGANHPGTLSGWHSRTLDGGGLNQWVIDDATGQARMRLASLSDASPWSELSLGHVIGQGATSSQRGAWLGSGFSAHTSGWTSVRAAEGLLLSTTARAGSYGSAQSTQMDAQEAVAQLKSAQQLGQNLGQAANAQGAMTLTSHQAEDTQAVQALLKAIDAKQDGQYSGAVGGQEAKKAKAGARDLDDPVERFAKPYVVLDTPSTAAFASPAGIAAFSGQDTSITAQGDVHAAAAHTISLVSGQTTSLYTHEGEFQAIAANGNLSLRAHTDQLEILADKDISVVSVNDEITVTAKRIEMVGGDSKIVLDGANIDYVTPGLFEVKAAQHSWAGPGSGSAELEALPQGLAGTTPLVLELSHHWPDLTPMAGAPYRAVFADGSRRTGTLDAHGQARLEGIPSGLAEVVYGEEARPAALQPVTLQPVDDESLAADLRRLGLDPDTVDLQALVERHAGRTS
jgi:type VI secretion system secreted protein VgrG